jgi:hypothetical protein
MSEPWFNPVWFGALYGSIVGGVGGSLAGLLGGLAGWLAPQGKGRPWILGGFMVFIIFGLLNLAVGVYALAAGQPYGIWYPLLLVGVVLTIVESILFPVVRRRYREAEERRLEAETFRQS